MDRTINESQNFTEERNAVLFQHHGVGSRLSLVLDVSCRSSDADD